jgi:Rieske Fe-S protein
MATPIPERETISLPPDGRPLQDQPAWRQDFPIDWPQDEYVERRDFVKFLTLTSLAFAVGQFWIAGQSWMRRRSLPPDAKRVAALSAIPVGGSIVFDYPAQHDSCVLVRLSTTDLVAFSQKCTHLSCAVYYQPAKGRLECPCHEGYFSARDGSVLQGPPPRPLPRVVLERHGPDLVATGVEG